MGTITASSERQDTARGRPAATTCFAVAGMGGAWYAVAMSDTSNHAPDPVRAARNKAFVLYEGTRTPHRSCGICLAETFGLGTRPYQSLRRGGLDGQGECGAIKAGELVLGEILGDPDPAGGVTAALGAAMARYREHWRRRLAGQVGESLVCNDLTAPLGEFHGEARRHFCTRLASQAAAAVAETLVEAGVGVVIEPPVLDAPLPEAPPGR